VCLVGLLLCYEAGRIDGERLLEIGQRLLQFPGFDQNLALMNIGRRGQEAYILEGGTIGQVGGLELVSLMVKLVGRNVILPNFGGFALLKEGFSGFVVGGECGQNGADQ
jgi:hypothetical protein